MMFKKITFPFLIFSSLLMIGINNPVKAAVIGASEGSGPSTETEYDSVTTPNQETGWFIGSEATPQEVAFDPTKGSWSKKLNITVTGVRDFFLEEYLTVVGKPWVDWHERITIISWLWTDAQFKVKRPGDVDFIDAPGLDFLIVDNQVDFKFDPLPHGTIVNIIKKLRYTGTGDSGVFIRVREYPTVVPEPTSTLSLLALGTLGAASTLKRKLKPSQSTEKETTKVG